MQGSVLAEKNCRIKISSTWGRRKITCNLSQLRISLRRNILEIWGGIFMTLFPSILSGAGEFCYQTEERLRVQIPMLWIFIPQFCHSLSKLQLAAHYLAQGLLAFVWAQSAPLCAETTKKAIWEREREKAHQPIISFIKKDDLNIDRIDLSYVETIVA